MLLAPERNVAHFCSSGDVSYPRVTNYWLNTTAVKEIQLESSIQIEPQNK